MQSHIILGHTVVHSGNFAAFVHQCQPVRSPQKPAQIPQHGGLSGADCPDQQQAGRLPGTSPAVQRFGTAGHGVGNAEVQSADMPHLHQFAFLIDCRAGNAHPIAASNGDEALCDLLCITVDGVFTHRLKHLFHGFLGEDTLRLQ